MTLAVHNLTCARGGRIIVAGVNFTVPPGGAMHLAGPNGTGKTTLLRTIANLIPAHTGTVTLQGEAEVGPNCHWIGHLNAIKPDMSVEENLDFWARFLGGDTHTITDALARLGLDGLQGVPAGYLSAGQTRRLALARLLIAERTLWLLDEPTVSLDAQAVACVEDMVADHRGRGGMVLLASHTDVRLAQATRLTLESGPALEVETHDVAGARP